jgi:hypothetical protein
MREPRPNATLADAGSAAAQGKTLEAGGPAERAETPSEFVVLTHEALFVEARTERCDACGEHLGEDEAGDGFGIPGRGVYLRARGEETQLESAPLCASCASAIGMTALARWEIEEEEG